ncbi:MAG: hypothetical protein IPJ27_05490 [Candidatus Accumulibacter sp.]|uniref:FHA domain-containing protein n=1 Tax=Candidatus Accumulibacter proximus TaxID=2954385 RepID=A0A935PZM6_9PROT|nr:hypothetical protein [Candidatus Accumulibacter proximus]
MKVLCSRCKREYDDQMNTNCPHCPIEGLDLNDLEADPRPAGQGPSRFPPHGNPKPGRKRTLTPLFPQRRTKPKPWPDTEAVPKTASRGTVSGLGSFDPVVGWLVATEGPERGRDFQIRAGNNSIGAGDDQAISLGQDEAVHSSEHAFIVYDPRSNTFTLRAGVKRGTVYWGRLAPEEETEPEDSTGVEMSIVIDSKLLQPYDLIDIGQSTLVFVPLCNEIFEWPESLPEKKPSHDDSGTRR